MKTYPFLRSLLLMLLLSCTIMARGQEKHRKRQVKKVSILFIGNSLTYTNNLPKLVRQRAYAAYGIKISTEMIARPGYALFDHLEEGEVQQKIRSGKFDYVIVQQGPSSQNRSRDLLFEAVQKYSNICRENGSRLCLFMVWPSLANYDTFDKVIRNHRRAAVVYGAKLCPVGAYWKTHFDRTENFDLYGPDLFHPSLKGSKVAANVIVSSLFDP